MARGRAANGSGMQPRLRPDGRWEVRYTAGINPSTGKKIIKSIYGKTSEEVAKKLREVTAAIDAGTFTEPKRMFLREWLDIWLAEYTGAIKPGTLKTYTQNVELHIKPALGGIRLCELQPHDCQAFVNRLGRPKKGKKPLAAHTIKNIHGTLCKALSEAVRIKYISSNPANGTILPKVIREEIHPLEGEQITAFLQAIQGTPSEAVFYVAIHTGMRLSELLGLRWSRVDLKKCTIKVDAQMLVKRGSDAERQLGPTKNGKARTFRITQSVANVLKAVQLKQKEQRMKAGPLWANTLDLVFTDDAGHGVPHSTVEHRYKRIMDGIGLPDHRFHDLRHTYATEAIRCGVDLKTLSDMLGHYSTAFTMDVYGHTTNAMQDDAVRRLELAINERKAGL